MEYKKLTKEETIEVIKRRGRGKWKDFYLLAVSLEVGESIRATDYVNTSSREYNALTQLVYIGMKKEFPDRKFSLRSSITGMYVVRIK